MKLSKMYLFKKSKSDEIISFKFPFIGILFVSVIINYDFDLSVFIFPKSGGLNKKTLLLVSE